MLTHTITHTPRQFHATLRRCRRRCRRRLRLQPVVQVHFRALTFVSLCECVLCVLAQQLSALFQVGSTLSLSLVFPGFSFWFSNLKCRQVENLESKMRIEVSHDKILGMAQIWVYGIFPTDKSNRNFIFSVCSWSLLS